MGIEPLPRRSRRSEVVVAQRLVRVICTQCKQQTPDDEVRKMRAEFGKLVRRCSIAARVAATAHSTGYRGRQGSSSDAISDEVRSLILRRPPSHEIRTAAVKEGMKEPARTAGGSSPEGTTIDEVITNNLGRGSCLVRLRDRCRCGGRIMEPSRTPRGPAGRRLSGTVPPATRRGHGSGHRPRLACLHRSRAATARPTVTARRPAATSRRQRRAPVVGRLTRAGESTGRGAVALPRWHLLRREVNPGAKNVWSQVHDEVVGGHLSPIRWRNGPRPFHCLCCDGPRWRKRRVPCRWCSSRIADFRTRAISRAECQRDDLPVHPPPSWPAACHHRAADVFHPEVLRHLRRVRRQSALLTHHGVDEQRGVEIFPGSSYRARLLRSRQRISDAVWRRFVDRAILKAPGIGKVVARFALVDFAACLVHSSARRAADLGAANRQGTLAIKRSPMP